MDREFQALLALVRAGLWGRYDEAMASLFPLSAESWERVFALSRQQTVTGIAFRGLDYLPDEVAPSMGLAVKWMAYADRIEQSNVAVNETLVKLYRHFAATGWKAVLEKGPGVAMMYPEPLLRESGDIDLFFTNNDKEVDPLKGIPGAEMVDAKPDGSWEYEVNGIIVERHSYLVDVLSPRPKKFVRKLIEDKGFETVNIAGCDVMVPAPEVNLILLSSHILKHAIGVGIGLRQLCDMAVAIRYYADRINSMDMKEIYRQAGLQKWSELLDAFLSEYLGLDACCDVNAKMAKKTRSLLDIIVKGGNFGHLKSKSELASPNKLSRKLRTLSSFWGNLSFALTYAPGEWLCTMIQLAGGQTR